MLLFIALILEIKSFVFLTDVGSFIFTIANWKNAVREEMANENKDVSYCIPRIQHAEGVSNIQIRVNFLFVVLVIFFKYLFITKFILISLFFGYIFQ